jgi:tetratricopeptide (TPR) repeat protein
MLEPSFAQKKELADLLLNCPCLETASGYSTVRRQLPANIRQNLPAEVEKTSNQLIIDLLDVCLKYPRGLYELYTIVEHFNGGSKPFVELENFIFGQYIAEFNKQFPNIVNYPLLPLVPGALTNSAANQPASDFGDDLLDLIGGYEMDVRATPANPADFTPKLIEGEKRVELEQYLNEKKKLVLVGLPGAGKTTALRRLGLLLAKNWRTPENLPKELAGRIPIYVPLNLWSNPQQSLKDYIADRLTTGESHFWAFAALLDGLLESNRLLLLLDGLNEIPQLERDEEKKFIKDARFDQIVELATSRYKGLACLFSCRQDDFVVNDKEVTGWAYLNMQPLGKEEVQAFAEWFVKNYRSPQPVNPELVPQLIAAIFDMPQVESWEWEKIGKQKQQLKWQQVVRQPFYLVRLLSFCCRHNIDGLPSNLTDLLKEDVETAAHIAKKRNRIAEAAPVNELIEHLSLLAFNMTDAKQVGADTLEQAASWLFFLRHEEFWWVEPKITPQQLLQARIWLNLANHINVIYSTPNQGVIFAHQLLQEYFAALYVQNHFYDSNLASRVLHNVEFWEVQKIWRELADQIQQALEIMERTSNLTASKERIFATEVLIQSAGHNQALRIISTLITALRDVNEIVRRNSAVALSTYTEYTESMLAIEPLVMLLQDSDPGVRSSAAQALGKYSEQEEVVIAIEPLINLLGDTDVFVQREAAYSLMNLRKHFTLGTLNKLLQATISTRDTLYAVSEIAYYLKQYSHSENYAVELLRIAPDVSSVYLRVGLSILGQGNRRRKEAVKAFKEYIKLSAGYDANSKWRAWWAGVDNSETISIFELEEIYKTDLGINQYIEQLCQGTIELLRANYNAAITAFTEASLLYVVRFDTMFWLGMTYAYINDLKEAFSNWQMAMALDLPCGLLHPIGWLRDKLPPEDWEKARAFWATYDPDAPKE